jgi:hypothetical protein
MQSDPDFDAKLDEALASYADPVGAGDPHMLMAGLLTAIEVKQQQRRWRLSLAFAAPVLACVLLAVYFVNHPFRPMKQSIPAFQAHLPPASPTQVQNVERVHMSAIHSQAKRLPKLDQFPTPAPLTEQERLLIQFAGQASESTQQQVAKMQKQSDEPLRIADLMIPKLDFNPQP